MIGNGEQRDPLAEAEKAMVAIESVVRTLGPLNSEERSKVVQAALVILGESQEVPRKKSEGEGSAQLEGLPPRATLWMKQNGLTSSQIEQVLHLDGSDASVIVAEIPGRTNRDKTRNAYLLAGLASLLSSGEPNFQDKAARSLCEEYGFYDHTNHSKYLKGGNEFTGSKEKGWTVTAPGLRRGAVLVTELSSGT